MIKEKIKCKHFCSSDHYCVWLQNVCDESSDLCIFEFNQYWRKHYINIQLTLF